RYILEVLNATNWRVNGPKGAAALLGVPPSTLRSKMSKLGIKRS
ncbi:MAG: AAA family ATPase, partial [Gemmatimonadetes bacterium]|nr:AAA family ATPase [Gemmatimonadota bacterium]